MRVQTLAQQALAHSNTISTDAYRTIEGLIAALDKKLSDQMNPILHHEEFQKLEGHLARPQNIWSTTPTRTKCSRSAS